MSIFKCKMCGATLNIPKDTNVFKCEYCDTEQTIPIINSQEKEDLYERANYFFHNNEYDKATKIYEEISNLDPRDPESYFMQSLCKYGIEYVEDPKSKKRIPTLHRLHFESISNDTNYKKAIKHADSAQKIIYEKEANYIDEVRNKILDISKKEKPYDVFICYKETDEKGQRTEDSVIAMDIYNELTKEGLKVFFSRVTLEGKLGVEYEPYIFAALNSAKVMVVVGTKPEYINSPWVRNEWTRFIDRIDGSKTNKKNAEKCYIVPAYKGMSPYALPNEFSSIQSQDMSKVGATQDLVHGIKKLINKRSDETEHVDKGLNKKTKIIGISVAILVVILSMASIMTNVKNTGPKINIRGTEYSTNNAIGTLYIRNVSDFNEEDINKIKKIKSINLLYFQNCKLDNLKFLSELKNINGLELYETDVYDYSLNDNCDNIKILNIRKPSGTTSFNDDVKCLRNMPKIEKIEILMPKDLSVLSNHERLEEISLNSKGYNDIDFSWCEGLGNLKKLKLSKGNGELNYIGSNPFKGLENLLSLEELRIRGKMSNGMMEIEQNHLDSLANLKSINTIDFSLEGTSGSLERKKLSLKCFENASKIRNLRINASYIYELSDFENMIDIERIDLGGSSQVIYANNSDMTCLKNLNKLEYLSFNIEDEGYTNDDEKFSFKGVEKLKNLKTLYVNVQKSVKLLDKELLNNIVGLNYQIIEK